MKLNKWISIIVVIVALLVTAKMALATAPPTFDVPDQTVAEDAVVQLYDLRTYVNDSEHPDDELVFALTGETGSAVIDCALDADGYTLRCAPQLNKFGDSVVTVTATPTENEGELVKEDTFKITVTPVNDAPVVNSIAGDTSLFEAEEFTWTVTVSDIENDAWVVDPNTSTVDGKKLSETSWVTVNGVTATGFTLKGTAPEVGEAKNYVFSIVVKETTTIPALSAAAKDQTLSVKPYFAIKSLEINGKSSGDLSLEETNEITVQVRNDFTED